LVVAQSSSEVPEGLTNNPVLPPGDELHVLILYLHAPIHLCVLILIHSVSLTSV